MQTVQTVQKVVKTVQTVQTEETVAVLGGPLAPGTHSCGGLEMKMIVFWNRAMIFVGISGEDFK